MRDHVTSRGEGTKPVTTFTRREFLATGATAIAASTALPVAAQSSPEPDFEFALLGDTHFDRTAHHDHEWLAREQPNDVPQVAHYSEHTTSLLPHLFATVKRQLAAAGKRAEAVVHVGDFVEGLCGTPGLAERHVSEACEFADKQDWQVPVLLTKGNHDKTGPGAIEAYQKVIQPWLGRQVQQTLKYGFYAEQRQNALFCCFDAYDGRSLDWLKETLGRNADSRRHTFVVVHQPVVPFQARGNWSVFMRSREAKQRAELLQLLGEHRAIVLCGHVHRYGTVVRRTERGPFAQLCLSSILSGRDQQPRQHLEGLDAYGPNLTELDPNFQPESKETRHKQIAAEKPHIAHFEYADTAGYAMLRVRGDGVTARIFNGTSEMPWKELNLTTLLKNA